MTSSSSGLLWPDEWQPVARDAMVVGDSGLGDSDEDGRPEVAKRWSHEVGVASLCWAPI